MRTAAGYIQLDQKRNEELRIQSFISFIQYHGTNWKRHVRKLGEQYSNTTDYSKQA